MIVKLEIIDQKYKAYILLFKIVIGTAQVNNLSWRQTSQLKHVKQAKKQ